MITLRDNQRRFDAAVRAAMSRHKRVCAVAPTGFGKRVWAVDAMCRSVEKGKRVALVTDRQILVRQARDECREHNIPYGVVMGAEPVNPDAPIQICSIQTLERREWKDNPAADWLAIDEAHKTSNQYVRLIEKYPDAWVIGLTATPVGADDKSLAPGLFDVIVDPVKNTELIRDGWLLPTRVICPCEPDVKGVKIINSTGEYSQKTLGERMQAMWIHANVWKHWEPYQDDQTIVFVPRLAFARFLVEEFKKRGHVADIIEAATTTVERDILFQRFAERHLRVLVSVDVLREGFDAPIARVAIDLQPNAKLRTWWQKVGRIRRPHEGQDHAVLLDFGGNFWRHGLHPDENPDWPQNGETTAELLKQRRERIQTAQKEPWQCSQCHYTLSHWERIRDGACPNCGCPLGRPTRRIVMGDGTMKEVSARQRKQKSQSDVVKTWFCCLMPCFYEGRSLHQAARWFHDKTGKWPEQTELRTAMKGAMGLPPPRSSTWKMAVRAVYPQLGKRR